MKNFDTRTYNISDFIEWHQSGLLELSPKFQRKSVWTEKAKSYLIDTILRGKPMPKILITQKIVDGKNVRTVVDGQQRLRAIIDFIEDGFSVSRIHNKEFAGKFFSELDEDIKNEIRQYEIGVDLLFNIELPEILDIFARLNTYSVKLNKTEQLNAQYLGSFKTSAHRLGHQYADFFLNAKILTNAKITRMGEVEIIADILGSVLEGISAKKPTIIENFYKKYDDSENEVQAAEDEVVGIFRLIAEIIPPERIAQTEFRRVHLFYALFMAILKINRDNSETLKNTANLRVRIESISSIIADAQAKKQISGESDEEFKDFIYGLRNATTDKSVRIQRVNYLISRIRG